MHRRRYHVGLQGFEEGLAQCGRASGKTGALSEYRVQVNNGTVGIPVAEVGRKKLHS